MRYSSNFVELDYLPQESDFENRRQNNVISL